MINISFLDEQFTEIEGETEGRKTSGIIGNLKRWHRDIYDQYTAKKISLEQAVELSKIPRETIVDPSHPDSTPIAHQSQSVAEKKRLEQIRLEEEKKRLKDIPAWEDFLAYAVEKKPKVSKSDLKLKYEAWRENGWKVQRGGKLQPIKNWKATLLNTLPYIAEVVIKERRVSL